ncbi:MAG: NfeD family protein [Clostridiales bacterium]|nr:NfeD family protein [Clostridiales bacterium]
MSIELLSSAPQLLGFDSEIALWVALTIIFVIIEACTATLLTSWFAIGSIVAAILAALGAGFGWQVAVFFVVSLTLLFTTRPLLNKYLIKKTATNKDTLIGVKAFATQTIDNLAETGYVKINGVLWAARSSNGDVINENTLVEIIQIQGNKLIVSPAKETTES